MSSNEMEKIQALLDMKYQKSRTTVATILKREAALRMELRKLDEQEKNARADSAAHMKMIGADIIWQGWVGRMRTKLNQELALLLAQKDVLMRNVKKDFGRVTVSGEMAMRARTARQKAEKSASLQRVIDQALLQTPKRL